MADDAAAVAVAVAHDTTGVRDIAQLAGLLRTLRRREARARGDSQLTYRELAARTGWSLGTISSYFAGKALAPTDRFDVLIQLLSATPAEQRALATARDRVEEEQRGSAAGPGADTDGRRPQQLPTDVHGFTGRAEEMASLDLLLHGQPATTTTAICAVSGAAGIGKTALVIRWAHRVRDEFPGGQLYVNLHGYDVSEPVSADDALAGLLRALGVTDRDIPVDIDERAARYRSELHGRRILVVLDNAATAEQVRPLLPGTPSCVVVITSRDSLAGLVARHGVGRFDLDLLPMADAITLLRRLIGARVDDDPGAAAALAEQCARLPLALRVAAELVAARPALTLARLVDDLSDERRRLDLLDAGGDPRTTVRGVFSWSWRHLPAGAARVFRLIGLHPGTDIDAHAAAALTDSGRDHAADLLELLARAHLIHPTGPGRYGMHDLLRAYGVHLCAAHDGPGCGPGEARAALSRLFDYYLATAATAMDAIAPAERDRRPPVPQLHTPAPSVAGPIAARAWLDAERANLVRIAAHAARRGWPGHATRLSATVSRYLETGGHYTEAVTIHTHAHRAARLEGDGAAEAYALNNLGIVHGRLGRYPQAAECLEQALELFRHAGDRSGDARALANLGVLACNQGRYGQAVAHHEQALQLFRAIGERAGEAEALNGLGEVLLATGSPAQARVRHAAALALAGATGDQHEQARARAGLARADRSPDEVASSLS